MEDSGILTPEEFSEDKQKILSWLQGTPNRTPPSYSVRPRESAATGGLYGEVMHDHGDHGRCA